MSTTTKQPSVRQLCKQEECLEALCDRQIVTAHLESLVIDLAHKSDRDLAALVIDAMTDHGLLHLTTFAPSFVRACIAHTIAGVLTERNSH